MRPPDPQHVRRSALKALAPAGLNRRPHRRSALPHPRTHNRRRRPRLGRKALTRLLLTGFLVAALALQPVSTQAAVPVIDLVHISETIAHYLARLVEIQQKYAQIQQQLQQIEIALQNLEKLDTYYTREVGPTLRAMEGALTGHLIPSHLSPTVRQAHSEAFRGWELPVDWWEEEEIASSAALRTMRETLWAKHLQHRTTREHLSLLGDMEAQVAAAEGHEASLEALASLLSYATEAQVLAQLSEQTSADAATAYYSYQVNRRTRSEVALREAIRTSIQDPPSLDGGWGALPSWWSYP